ncbi:type II secretion system F family protein [Streptomyces sp. 71268]|uniref:type II secretion system F family protein n=1 Tax=Streptomyces sp. 71268 TaxID=3002640 RepID=UPI0023F97C9D|nr:type II secretion system F family protein [Streptomyces sp. 71268]WEV29819.1 type II secretion system F family protein [Streptomyces sp. 71268]
MGGAVTVEPLVLCAVVLCLVVLLWDGAGSERHLRRGRLILADCAVPPSGIGKSRPGERMGPSGGLTRLLASLGQGAGWPRWRERLPGPVRRWDLGGELACLPAGCVLALLTDSVLPLVGAALAAPVGWRWRRARAVERHRARTSAAVIALCAAVSGELRAGRQPGEALRVVDVADLPDGWEAVTTAARFGGDVPTALREVARSPGAEGLAGVAACWQVAVDGGAGLADGLDRVAAALRAERNQREELRAQLAGVRSTAVMLALLPAFGLVLGSALGAGPLHVLLHTPAGLSCLLLGVLLEVAGLAWTAHIVRRAAGLAKHTTKQN